MKNIIFLLSFFVFIQTSFAYTVEDIANADYLAQKNIITAQSDGAQYRLDNTITRAETIGISLKIKGISLPENYVCRKYFKDTIKDDWVCRAMELAADNGIISRANSSARPQDKITQAEAVAILMSSAGLSYEKNIDKGQYGSDAVQWKVDLEKGIEKYRIGLPGIVYDDVSALRREIINIAAYIKNVDTVNPFTTIKNTEIRYSQNFQDIVDTVVIKQSGKTTKSFGGPWSTVSADFQKQALACLEENKGQYDDINTTFAVCGFSKYIYRTISPRGRYIEMHELAWEYWGWDLIDAESGKIVRTATPGVVWSGWTPNAQQLVYITAGCGMGSCDDVGIYMSRKDDFPTFVKIFDVSDNFILQEAVISNKTLLIRFTILNGKMQEKRFSLETGKTL